MSARTVELAPGVWRIPTFVANFVNSFLLENADGSLTLIDAGIKGGDKRLVAALQSLGKQPEQVTRIIASHAHSDHVGGLRGLQQRTGSATTFAPGDDADNIRRGKAPPRDRSFVLGRVLQFLGSGMPRAEVDETFTDNQLLDVAGGLRVLHTPGHTPGHCSFLHERSGVLITGDSLFNWRHRLRYSYAGMCTNYRMCVDTADRLGEPEYEVAAFMHGPEMRDHAREHIREFLRRRLRESS